MFGWWDRRREDRILAAMKLNHNAVMARFDKVEKTLADESKSLADVGTAITAVGQTLTGLQTSANTIVADLQAANTDNNPAIEALAQRINTEIGTPLGAVATQLQAAIPAPPPQPGS